MNNVQEKLVEAILLYASDVLVDDAKAGHFECNDAGEGYQVYMNDKEFEEVRDYILSLIK